MKIAALLTCHNRKEKTLQCLRSLYVALDVYNDSMNEKILLTVYLTDDGCTDGTAEAIRESFHQRDVHILKGDGNMYWAGGMRYAWKTAMEDTVDWDLYLLLNDDVILFDNCLKDLMDAHGYSLEHYHQAGMYSGITCAVGNPGQITYGGWNHPLISVLPNGVPQMCDIANANILLVSGEVVSRIGIFYEGYQHGIADFDYSRQVRSKGIPVLVTAHICGECNQDHGDSKTRREKIMKMSFAERKKHFNHPIYSSSDYLTYIKRNEPLRYPLVFLGRLLNLYCPQVYYLFHE